MVSNSGLHSMHVAIPFFLYSRTGLQVCFMVTRSVRGLTTNVFRPIQRLGIVYLIGPYPRFRGCRRFFSIFHYLGRHVGSLTPIYGAVRYRFSKCRVQIFHYVVWRFSGQFRTLGQVKGRGVLFFRL